MTAANWAELKDWLDDFQAQAAALATPYARAAELGRRIDAAQLIAKDMPCTAHLDRYLAACWHCQLLGALSGDLA